MGVTTTEMGVCCSSDGDGAPPRATSHRMEMADQHSLPEDAAQTIADVSTGAVKFQGKTDKEVSTILDKMFEGYDQDDSGFLDRKEFLQVTRDFCLAMSLVLEKDWNETRESAAHLALSEEEKESHTETAVDKIKVWKEMANNPQNRAALEAKGGGLFQEADVKDQDDKVSKEEFKVFLQSNEHFEPCKELREWQAFERQRATVNKSRSTARNR